MLVKRGVVFLIVFLVLAAGALAINSNSTSTDEWRMWGGTLDNNRYVNVNVSSTILDEVYATYTIPDGDAVTTAAIVANGYVYVGARDNVYQLNASNISTQVANFTPDTYVYHSAPTAAGDYIYFADYAGTLYQLNASNISHEIGRYNVTIGGERILASVIVYDDYVYTGGYDGVFHQLNATNVSQGSLNNYTNTGGDIQGHPVYYNGFVYFTNYLGTGQYLYKLNATNVSIVNATSPESGHFYGGPLAVNGYIFVGVESGGLFYQYDASTLGTPLESYDTPSSIRDNGAASPDYVYVQDEAGEVYQFNSSNLTQLIGIQELLGAGAQFYSSPLVTADYVFVAANQGGDLYQLDADNISTSINTVDFNIPTGSSPTYAGGFLYIGGDDGASKLYQLGSPNPTLDSDADGIVDLLDDLWYTEDNVTTSGITSLNITIDGNSTSGSYANTVNDISFYDGATLLMNFTHNFSTSVLDLSQVSITMNTTSLVVNLSSQVQELYNKTLFIADNSFATLCVENAEIASATEISDACNETNELDFTGCIGNSTGYINGSVTCTDLGSTIQFENLRYSGITATVTASSGGGSSSSSSSSGGGGGSGRSKGRSVPDCIEGYSLVDGLCRDDADRETSTGEGDDGAETSDVVDDMVGTNSAREELLEDEEASVGSDFETNTVEIKSKKIAKVLVSFILVLSVIFLVLFYYSERQTAKKPILLDSHKKRQKELWEETKKSSSKKRKKPKAKANKKASVSVSSGLLKHKKKQEELWAKKKKK